MLFGATCSFRTTRLVFFGLSEKCLIESSHFHRETHTVRHKKEKANGEADSHPRG
jgi:hypothetical protein